MSEYYTVPIDVVSGVRARSAKINELIQSIEDGFDELPADLSATSAEVIAARDGESSLLVKNQAQDTAIALNTAKDTNVSTNLSEGTSTETTVDVNSSDGTNATLLAASTLRAGIMTKAKFDEVETNTSDIASLVAGTVPDNSITLAKMASGTDGNLITYDASGDPAYVATGTAGQVLTSTGAGSPPTFQTGVGLVLLQSVTASNSATVVIEDDFTSAYENYMIVISNVVNSMNYGTLYAQLKIGGTYRTNNYRYHMSISKDDSNLYVGAVSISSTHIVISDQSIGITPGNDGMNFRFYLSDPSASKKHSWYWHGCNVDNTRIVNVNGAAHNATDSGATTGIKFFMSGGNITSGTFSLYGLRG